MVVNMSLKNFDLIMLGKYESYMKNTEESIVIDVEGTYV